MVGPSELRMLVKKYIDAVKTHDVIFGVGPAGTGKTFLVVMAVAALKKAKYKNYFNSSSGGSWRKLGLYQVT